MATILGNWFGRIKNGWKTVGAPGGPGAFASNEEWTPDSVSAYGAMKLSAYFACVRLLSETMGSMSFKLYDETNKLVTDHALYDLMSSPNTGQTGDAFVSAMTANKTVSGNSMAHIKRLAGKPYTLDFYATELWTVGEDKQGRPTFQLDGVDIPNEDVLHWPGMSLGGYWGLPTLAAGAEVLSMQTQSNRSAAQLFKNGLKTGGFFLMPEDRQALTDPQLDRLDVELKKMSRPENTGKWMPLLPGMKPAENAGFRVDPVTAELLQSRYFGIEEICRFMGVPPPLIGHTDKASSWASSLDGLNQFLVTYTLLPQAIRFENEIARKLLGRNDRNRLRPRFNLDSLLRGDITKRFATYKIAIDSHIMTPNETRNIENMPPIAGGDKFPAAKPATNPAAPAKE